MMTTSVSVAGRANTGLIAAAGGGASSMSSRQNSPTQNMVSMTMPNQTQP